MTQLTVAGEVPAWHQGDFLRKAREHAGMSQAELADVTGISRRTVVRYESGEASVRRPQLIAWAMATGVPLAWLESGHRPEPTGADLGRRVTGRSLVQVQPRERMAPVRYLRTGASSCPERAA